MKKRTMLFSMGLLAAGLLAGCGNTKDNVATSQATEAKEQVSTKQEETTKVEGNLKTGLAFITSISDSQDAVDKEGENNDKDGVAQADVTAAAVTLDDAGKIVSCTLDGVQVKIAFDDDGKITTNLAEEIKTKQELGEAYGMKAASSIGKEWNEQADAFAAYCVGKTAEEVENIAVTEDGKAEDTDLLSSCTISIDGFKDVVMKAVDNAK